MNQVFIKFLSEIDRIKGINLIQYIVRFIAHHNAIYYDNITEIKTNHCWMAFFNICYANHEGMLTCCGMSVNS